MRNDNELHAEAERREDLAELNFMRRGSDFDECIDGLQPSDGEVIGKGERYEQ